MNGLTLKHLRYFMALAQHTHFGRAAEVCGISQPALSLQIRELEALMGAPLVERAARQVRLTTLGEDLQDRAAAILSSVEELDDLVRAKNGPLAGRLRLGVIPTAAPYLLPQVMAALSRRFPALELEPRETITQTLLEELRASRLDVAILALPVSEPGLQAFALFEEDFVLVRPLRDAHLPVPSPESLQDMRLLLLEEGHCFRDQALSFCNTPNPRTLMEGSSLSTLVQMVGAGLGVTLIPEMAIALETRGADVSVARFPPGPGMPQRTMGMVWRKTNPLSQQLMEVGAILRSVARPAP